MRTAVALLVVLLTATAAWAGIRVPGREGELSRQEEVGLYCSVCMVVVFVPVLIWLICGPVYRWFTRRGTKPPKSERIFQPPSN